MSKPGESSSGRDDADQSGELALALERARSKARALSEVIRSSGAIQSSLDRGAILEKVIEESTRLMQADVGSLMVLDAERNELVYEVATGTAGDTIEKFRLPVGTGIAGWVAKHGEALNIPDAYQDPRFFPDYDRQTGYRTRSVLCVPLKVQGRVIGIAQVINKMPTGSVFTQDDLEIFSDFANVAAVAVETSRMHDDALRNARQRERIAQELTVAKEVQSSFLPREFPVVPGVRFHAASVPAREVGGDLYDVFELGDGRVGVVLGDVSGKGVSAALYMAKVASDLRLLAETTLDVSELLFKLNNRLARRAQRGMFVTLAYLQIDPVDRLVTVGNAGHLPPLVRDGDAGAPHYLAAAGSPPLGIAPDLTFDVTTHPYEPGSRFVLYTDGITEARNEARQLFGPQRLSEWLAGTGDESSDLSASLFTRVREFAGNAPASDDMTAVVVSFSAEGVEGAPPRERPRDVVRMSVPSDAAYMTVVRAAVQRVALSLGFDERVAKQLTLAVDEGCTNVIRHCYHGERNHIIELRLASFLDRIEIEVEDHGPPLDPERIKSRALDDVRPGGLGVHIIHSICDEASWQPGFPRGNILRMVKRLGAAGAGSS